MPSYINIYLSPYTFPNLLTHQPQSTNQQSNHPISTQQPKHPLYTTSTPHFTNPPPIPSNPAMSSNYASLPHVVVFYTNPAPTSSISFGPSPLLDSHSLGVTMINEDIEQGNVARRRRITGTDRAKVFLAVALYVIVGLLLGGSCMAAIILVLTSGD